MLQQSTLDIVVLVGQATGYGITTNLIGSAPIIGVRLVPASWLASQKGRYATGRVVCDLSLLDS